MGEALDRYRAVARISVAVQDGSGDVDYVVTDCVRGDLADAAIAELEAELKVTAGALTLSVDAEEKAKQRTIELEAERDAALAAMRVDIARELTMDELEKRVADLEAERDALKCCGNCLRYRMPSNCLSWECDLLRTKHGEQAFGHHLCHFTPSRWEARQP